MNPITRKSMSKLVTQPSFRAVGQKAAEWQTFETPENKRQIYGSGSTQAWLPYICLLFSGFGVKDSFVMNAVDQTNPRTVLRLLQDFVSHGISK